MLPDPTLPTTYGLPKTDYDSVVDPETDLAASEYESLAVDVAGMTIAGPRAWVVVDSTGAIVSHGAVWGNSNTVGIAPTASNRMDGGVDITWPATVNDINPTPDRQASHSVVFNGFLATAVYSAGPLFTSVGARTANTVTIYCADAAGAVHHPDELMVVGF